MAYLLAALMFWFAINSIPEEPIVADLFGLLPMLVVVMSLVIIGAGGDIEGKISNHQKMTEKKLEAIHETLSFIANNEMKENFSKTVRDMEQVLGKKPR